MLFFDGFYLLINNLGQRSLETPGFSTACKDLTLKHSQALVLDPSAVGFKITSFVERAKAALLD